MTVTINGTTGITTPALDNQGVAVVNRTGNGTLIDLQSDGTTVGSIGINGNEPYFTTSDGGFRIAANGALQPATSVGGVSDALEDLGSTAGRWRDLYLSGGVYLGGTGAANYLDDYEEGAWVPSGNTGIPAGGIVTSIGRYQKVGNMVTIVAFMTIKNDGTNIQIGGLPFVSSYYQAVPISHQTLTVRLERILSGESNIKFTLNATQTATHQELFIGGTYYTTA